MSPTAVATITDRFGRAYQPGARIVYPTRRGSHMELVEAKVLSTGRKPGYINDVDVIFAERNSGTEVTLRNLWDVVVIP